MTQELSAQMVGSLLPARPPEGHKGAFGHVFILAGSRGFTGAAKLAAEAASRSGVGLVTAGVPQPLGDVVAAGLLEAMTLPLPFTGGETLAYAALAPALAFADTKQAVVLGPGLSLHPDTRRFVEEFVRRCAAPLLIDADGLNALSRDLSPLDAPENVRVLTPHPGEMARLTGTTPTQVQKDREGIALRFAERHRCVLVLKGHRTVVAEPGGSCCVNPTGNSGMGTGGTGDVLSGLIGGLLAQGMSAFDAARIGVYVHGLAGDIAAEEMTQRGMIARDVVNAIPRAWRLLEESVLCEPFGK